jgi:hypothetical protein
MWLRDGGTTDVASIPITRPTFPPGWDNVSQSQPEQLQNVAGGRWT